MPLILAPFMGEGRDEKTGGGLGNGVWVSGDVRRSQRARAEHDRMRPGS